jgi:serine protease Do
LRIIRDGKERTLEVKVGKQPEGERSGAQELGRGGEEDDGNVSAASLGLQLDTLTDAARRQLGYGKEIVGALVTGIADGSPAEEAGMRPGDVILQVDRHDIDSARAAAAALAKASPPILLLIKRGESTVFLTLAPRKK